MSTDSAGHGAYPTRVPHASVEELIRAKNAKPIVAVGDLAADTFSSDDELDEFLTFTAAARHDDVA